MVDILIVEDNQELSGLLCEFLRAEGYVVSTAETGEKALSLYEKYGARLVLLDINLPGIDGFGVCSRIRERKTRRSSFSRRAATKRISSAASFSAQMIILKNPMTLIFSLQRSGAFSSGGLRLMC